MRRLLLLAVLAVSSCGQSSPTAPNTPPPPALAPEPTPEVVENVENVESPPEAETPVAPPEPVAVPASEEEPLPEMALEGSQSLSTGNPNYGDLEGGVLLPARGPGFVHNPRRPREAGYGTVEMVQSLIRAGARLKEQFPGIELWINDLSLEAGGRIRGHQSHQNGRDVDVLFFYRGPDGEPYPPVAVFVDREGRGVDFRDLSDPSDDVPLTLDVPRTWAFIEAYLEDTTVRVNRVFLAEHVRGMLLEQAHAEGANAQTIELFEAVTCQPNSPHDEHFHIRIYCTPEDIRRGCQDSHPLYPWHEAYLAEQGLQPQMSRRRRPRPPVTSRTQARQAAGEMDAEVHRWLDLREDWAGRPPRTGRPYCR